MSPTEDELRLQEKNELIKQQVREILRGLPKLEIFKLLWQEICTPKKIHTINHQSVVNFTHGILSGNYASYSISSFCFTLILFYSCNLAAVFRIVDH